MLFVKLLCLENCGDVWYCEGAMNGAFNAYNFKNWLDIFLGVSAEIRSSLQSPPLSKGETLLQ
jgi:hypothetical protein